jgi:hypothetical protein
MGYDTDTPGVAPNGIPIGNCSGGISAGTEFYLHSIGPDRYSLRAQNTAPYVYIVAYQAITSVVVINSLTKSNASTNQASDGSIVVNAFGNGVLSYSIDGVNFQASNIFNGLVPGTYQVRVRNFKSDVNEGPQTVQTNGFITVGYDDIVCDLQIGNYQTTGAPNGSINILSVNTSLSEPVEYRIDGGAWQDSGTFEDLTVGDHTVEVRFKNFTDCTDSEIINVDGTCDILLGAVLITHEQTKYGDDGVVTVMATSSNEPIEYSLNNGLTYQASNIFTGVGPGIYTVRVRDVNDCVAFQQIEVFKFKSPFVLFPIVNSHRVVLQSGPMVKANARQNFDNTLFADMKFSNTEKGCYRERVELADIDTQQFRSNYATNTVKVYDSADVLKAILTPFKRSSNLNKNESISAFFADAGAGKTQIFFDTGLPVFVEVGMDVVITDQADLNGTYEIEDITSGVGEAEGYQVLIISKNYTPASTIVSGTATFTYDIEPYEVYEAVIDWSAYPVGVYYLFFEGSDVQLFPYTARSEPIESRSTWKNTLVIEYTNYENDYQINYDTGITHRLRVEGDLMWPLPGGERVVHKDSKVRTIKLGEYVTRNPQLSVKNLPPYLLEKLPLAFAHDFFTVEEVEYQCEEDFEPEYIPNEALHNGTVKLIQVDFMNENSDDQGPDVDIDVLGTNDTLLGVPS